MKFIIFVLSIALCLTSSLANPTHHLRHHRLRTPDNHIFPMPDQIEGYTAYTLDQARHIKSILNPFVSYSVTLVVDAVLSHKMAPESYSCFMRGAFRKEVEGGYETLYYYRAFNPKNMEGKVYYGTFTAFYPNEEGHSTQFLGFTVDAHALRAEVYKN